MSIKRLTLALVALLSVGCKRNQSLEELAPGRYALAARLRGSFPDFLLMESDHRAIQIWVDPVKGKVHSTTLVWRMVDGENISIGGRSLPIVRRFGNIELLIDGDDGLAYVRAE